MATLIKENGIELIVKPKGKKWTLQELQDLVNGPIEIMPGIGKIRMIFDEEGRFKMKSMNRKATQIVHEALVGQNLRYLPTIVGDVLILDKGEKM